jgi:hypothetical protein
MLERGWGTLNAEDWGKGILPGTVNKQAGQAGEPLVGGGHVPSNQEWESLGEWRREETPQERREDPLPT